MNDMYYKHYIRTDERNRIIAGFSDGIREAQEGDHCIREDGSYQFRLLKGGAENPGLFTEEMIPLYKWEEGLILERTNEEIQQDISALPIPVAEPTTTELKAENILLTAQIQAATERNDFIEDCIAEIAGIVYS